jgi:hypothetical protein
MVVYFQTQNPNLAKFWRVLQRKMLIYYMYILRPFDIFYSVHFGEIWYILPRFGMFFKEKFGNPGAYLFPECCFTNNTRALSSARLVTKAETNIMHNN